MKQNGQLKSELASRPSVVSHLHGRPWEQIIGLVLHAEYVVAGSRLYIDAFTFRAEIFVCHYKLTNVGDYGRLWKVCICEFERKLAPVKH